MQENMPELISHAQWYWYTWRNHMRAEYDLPGGNVLTLAAPLNGGEVVFSTGDTTEGQDENIEHWSHTGHHVHKFTYTGKSEPDTDNDFYEFRYYHAE